MLRAWPSGLPIAPQTTAWRSALPGQKSEFRGPAPQETTTRRRLPLPPEDRREQASPRKDPKPAGMAFRGKRSFLTFHSCCLCALAGPRGPDAIPCPRMDPQEIALPHRQLRVRVRFLIAPLELSEQSASHEPALMTEQLPPAINAHILRLKIERFRGIKALAWYPSPGLNIVLGGGDLGKTTILDAIALLLNPTNSYVLTDSDYFERNTDQHFQIEAVVSLPHIPEVNQQCKMNWPWEWDGKEPILPTEVDAATPGQSGVREAVYVIRVRATTDFELCYEVLQPDNTVDHLSVALRRAIGLLRLAGDDRNDRDLRLVQGSALDRLLDDKTLRSRLGHELAKEDATQHLTPEAKAALSTLETTFQKSTLPTKLGLGITGGSGLSLNALVGLTADKNGIRLPIANWGAGTRRLAALAIGKAMQKERPITVVDEIERGLEPYRQRTLIRDLEATAAQVFITTHSAAVVSSSATATLWYLDVNGNLGCLWKDKIAQHQKADPYTFLSRLAIICEGVTEVGFVSVFLEKAITPSLADHGVWLADGQGHETTLALLEALSEGGLAFAGMVDNENKHPTRWSKLKARLGALLVQWPTGCIEEHVIPLFDPAHLARLIEDPEEEKTGMRRRSLADRLQIPTTDLPSIQAAAVAAGSNLAAIIIQAATGTIPQFATDKAVQKQFKAHGKLWFKSLEGGRELAVKVFSLGAWGALKPEVLPFVNAIRKALSLAELQDLSL